MKKIIASHPHGNANVRGVLNGLITRGLLRRYVTSVAVFSRGFWHAVSLIPGLGVFRRKAYNDSLKEQTVCYPLKELGRQASMRFGLTPLVSHESGVFCTDKECHYIDYKTACQLEHNSRNVEAVYCYEDVALKTFQKAKQLGKKCIYDLPIGYWRAMRILLTEEKTKNPEWAATLGGFKDSDEKLARKDEELRLADKIYVASTFTKKTVERYPYPLKNIEVIPYGFPPVNLNREYKPLNDRKIKALYVGGLSQRKGISYIFEACAAYKDYVDLTVVGKGGDGCRALAEALKSVTYIPTLPHDEILRLMSECDVLLFPSLFEGFGLVITEAMSQGTPVITTDRTCGPDIITSGKDGWIVDSGSAEPIKCLLESFVANPGVLEHVGREAMLTASKRPWSKYEEEMANSIESFLNDELS